MYFYSTHAKIAITAAALVVIMVVVAVLLSVTGSRDPVSAAGPATTRNATTNEVGPIHLAKSVRTAVDRVVSNALAREHGFAMLLSPADFRQATKVVPGVTVLSDSIYRGIGVIRFSVEDANHAKTVCVLFPEMPLPRVVPC